MEVTVDADASDAHVEELQERQREIIMTMESINPTTGETIKTYAETTPQQVHGILEQASAAFHSWRRSSFSERAALIRRAARILLDDKEEYATLMTREMGKPIAESRAEVEKKEEKQEKEAEEGKPAEVALPIEGEAQTEPEERQEEG